MRDARGWLLRDRFVLGASPAWDGVGLAEGASYFATIAAFGDGAWPTLPEDVDAIVAGHPGLRAAGGALGHRGFVVRCLAESATTLGDAVEMLWATARRRLLGSPPLSLRKL